MVFDVGMEDDNVVFKNKRPFQEQCWVCDVLLDQVSVVETHNVLRKGVFSSVVLLHSTANAPWQLVRYPWRFLWPQRWWLFQQTVRQRMVECEMKQNNYNLLPTVGCLFSTYLSCISHTLNGSTWQGRGSFDGSLDTSFEPLEPLGSTRHAAPHGTASLGVVVIQV
jgi:hypothetical protein